MFCFANEQTRDAFVATAEKHRQQARKGTAGELLDVSVKSAKLARIALKEADYEADKGSAQELTAFQSDYGHGTTGMKASNGMSNEEEVKKVLNTLPGKDHEGASAILERFRNGTRLVEARNAAASFAEMQQDIAEGQRQMHQAFQDALSHEALSHYLHGATDLGHGTRGAGLTAAQMALIIILALCCTGIICWILILSMANNGR